jgi:hypothetical protein
MGEKGERQDRTYSVVAVYPRDYNPEVLKGKLLETGAVILRQNKSVTRTLNGIKLSMLQFGLSKEWMEWRQYFLVELSKIKKNEGLICFLLRGSPWEISTLRATIETLGIRFRNDWEQQMDKNKTNAPEFYRR